MMDVFFGWFLGLVTMWLYSNATRITKTTDLAFGLFEEMSATGINVAQGTLSAAQTSFFEGQQAEIAGFLPRTLAAEVIRYYQCLIFMRDELPQNRNYAQDLATRRKALLPRLERHAKRDKLDLFLRGIDEKAR